MRYAHPRREQVKTADQAPSNPLRSTPNDEPGRPPMPSSVWGRLTAIPVCIVRGLEAPLLLLPPHQRRTAVVMVDCLIAHLDDL